MATFKMLVKNMTTGDCGLADVPCPPEQLTALAPIQINGTVIQLNIQALMTALGLKDCDANPVVTGSMLATCNNLTDAITDAIAALPPERYLASVGPYNAISNLMPLTMNDGYVIQMPMGSVITDTIATLTGAQVAQKIALVDCNTAPILPGTAIATCANLSDAINGLSFAVTTAGPVTGDGSTVNPIDVDFGALSAADLVSLLAGLNLRNCAGNQHTRGSQIPTCIEMNAAINAAIAALPAEKFLQGLQSYNPTTNIMTLLMNDGTTVPVDLTGLVGDAVTTALAQIDGSETKVIAGVNVTVTGAGTTANPYIIDGLATPVVPLATNTVAGRVALAVASNYPQPLNDVDATTPAYLQAAITAFAATLPAEKFLTGLQSYDPITNIMTLLMNDGSTVPVDMTGPINDVLAQITGAETKLTAGTNVTITGLGTTANPYVISAASGAGAPPTATDTVSGISPLAVAANYPQHANDTDSTTPAYVKAALDAKVIVSGDAGNIIDVGTDGGALLTAGGVVADICANNAAGDALAACLISTNAGNDLVLGTDGRLFVGVAVAPTPPTAGIAVTSGQAIGAVSMTLTGASNSGCATPGLTSGAWTVRDAANAIVASGSSLPGSVVVNLTGFTGPFVAGYTTTDACGTSVAATASFTASTAPTCASIIAACSGTVHAQYYLLAGDVIGTTGKNQLNSASGWGIGTAEYYQTSTGRVGLQNSGFDVALTGVSTVSGDPMLKPQIMSNTLSLTDIVSFVESTSSDLSVPDVAAEGEFFVKTGAMYIGCAAPANATYEFRLGTGAGQAESKAYFWDNNSPAALGTSNAACYYVSGILSGGIVQTISAPITASPGEKIGFVHAVWDAGVGDSSTIEVRVNGGAWINIQTAAGLTAANLVLNLS